MCHSQINMSSAGSSRCYGQKNCPQEFLIDLAWSKGLWPEAFWLLGWYRFSLNTECVTRNSPVLSLTWENNTAVKLAKVDIFPGLQGLAQNSKIIQMISFLFKLETIFFKIKSRFPWARCSPDTDSYSSEIKNWDIPNYSDFNLFLLLETINSSDEIGPILTPVWKSNNIPPD